MKSKDIFGIVVPSFALSVFIMLFLVVSLSCDRISIKIEERHEEPPQLDTFSCLISLIIEGGTLEEIRDYLDNHPNVLEKYKEYCLPVYTPLSAAAQGARTNVMSLLVERGANIRVALEGLERSHYDRHQEAALLLRDKFGDHESIRKGLHNRDQTNSNNGSLQEARELKELRELSKTDADAIRVLASDFRSAVNQRSLAALEALVHPDLLASVTTNQLSCLQGIYLASRFSHTIADAYSLRFAELDKEELQLLEERWHARWNPSPELLVELAYQTGPDKGTSLPLYVARKGAEWHLLTPIPPDGLVSNYLERTTRKQTGTTRARNLRSALHNKQ
jgi:hypothetical protein